MMPNQEFVLDPNKEVSLGEMKKYLYEWFKTLNEQIEPINFEKYDRELILSDESNNPIFHAIFEYGEPINDESKVYLCGIYDQEFQGVIGKMMYLDELIDYSKTKKVPQSIQPQKQ